jgi:hypothetical protein
VCARARTRVCVHIPVRVRSSVRVRVCVCVRAGLSPPLSAGAATSRVRTLRPSPHCALHAPHTLHGATCVCVCVHARVCIPVFVRLCVRVRTHVPV